MRSRWLPYILGTTVGFSIGLTVLLYFSLSGTHIQLVRSQEPEPAESVVLDTKPEPAPVPTAGEVSEVDLESRISQERGNAIVAASRRVSPSVVAISTLKSGAVDLSNPRSLFELLRRGPHEVVGLGSGFIVDHRGYILTTHHVVAGSTELVVTLRDGQRLDAQVVGTSPEFDLALIKINGDVSGLPVPSFGDSDALQTGEWAIAIGSPFSYLLEDTQPTVTVGVISAIHRDVKPGQGRRFYYDMIQTDAAINPGNSGGPLVNSQGEVVGINTTVISDGGGRSTGLGFAIPIKRGQWVMQEIFEYGRVRPYWDGLEGDYLSDLARSKYQIPDQVPDGFLVTSVAKGSPADAAGIRPHDIIVAVNGQPRLDDRSRLRLFYEARVGMTIQLRIWRNDHSFDVPLTFAEPPRPTTGG